MKITTNKDGSVCLSGAPEELVLFNKLSKEWNLFYGELKARGLSFRDILTSGANSNNFIDFIMGKDNDNSKEG